MKQKRESGYYWIRFNERWEIVEYFANYDCWQFVGKEFHDKDFEEIDENKIIRNHKIPLTEEILLELGFNKVNEKYHLILYDKHTKKNFKMWKGYRELICSLRGINIYNLHIVDGFAHNRDIEEYNKYTDSIFCLTTNLQYKEDLKIFIELLKTTTYLQ